MFKLGISIVGAALIASLIVACGDSSPPSQPDTTPLPPASATPTVEPTAQPTVGPPPLSRPLTDLPTRNLADLARRYRGVTDAPAVVNATPPAYNVGDVQEFWLLDPFAPSVQQVRTRLELVTPHAYFYAQDGAGARVSDLEALGRHFEEVIYPRVTGHFGNERRPGIDNDSRLTIVLAEMPGLGGYFSGSDAYPTSVSSYSNEREAIYLNVRMLPFGAAVLGTVLAHELQHLIHWSHDPDEEVWLNEGLSEVASELIESPATGAFIRYFMAAPDTQLNAWNPLEGSAAHYGAAHLFTRYLLQRYGGVDNARRLVARPEDSIEGINAYLDEIDSKVTFDEVFADWVIANFLDEPEGPYSHDGLTVKMSVFAVLKEPREQEGTVYQFGTDYIEVSPVTGNFDLVFDGNTTVPVVLAEPRSGSSFWWSGRGDNIDTTLTRRFDLRGVTSASLRFSSWHDIEDGWDYGYVAVSADNGRTWTALPGRYTNDKNPVGNAYGPGYTGHSGGWREETIDLSAYAGQEILVRFEYITDEGTNGPGWVIDDIAIPELGFSDDAESNDAGWEAMGFQRLASPLEQRFIVQVIEFRADGREVRRIALDDQNDARIRLSGFGVDLEKAIIVVSGATDGTTELATYRYRLEPVAGSAP